MRTGQRRRHGAASIIGITVVLGAWAIGFEFTSELHVLLGAMYLIGTMLALAAAADRYAIRRRF